MTSQRGTFGSYVTIDPARLAALLRDPARGPLVRRLIEWGEIVKRGAQRRAPVYQPDPADPFASRRERRPGTLRDTIVKRLAEADGLPVMLVGSDDPISVLVHEGTPPHQIAARRSPYLVFYWPKIGKVVVTKSVNHPGTKPQRFLVDALEDLRGHIR